MKIFTCTFPFDSGYSEMNGSKSTLQLNAKVTPCAQRSRISRHSHWHMFFKIGLLKNFAIYTGKNMRWSLFSIQSNVPLIYNTDS